MTQADYGGRIKAYTMMCAYRCKAQASVGSAGTFGTAVAKLVSAISFAQFT